MARASIIDEVIAEARTQGSNLCEFFESHLPQLRRIRVKDIPLRVLYNIALIIHSTQSHENDWMAFLNELGIVENRAIIYIKLKSKLKEELPIYLALTGPLFERLTFGKVVEAIMKNKRLDALREIKEEYVQSLLESPQSDSYVARRPTAPEADILEEGVSKDYSSQTFYEKYQKSHFNMDDKENGQKIFCDPVLMETETITVLILHADADIDVAERLLTLLRNGGFVAKTLSHFDHLLMMNSFDVFPALISAVDFIVPIVSESFLGQIHSGNTALLNVFDNVEPSEIDDVNYFSHNSNNRYIYQLILNQYVRNRCLNFNVRPVMIPHFNRNLLTYESLLKQSYRLWESVPDFIVMLNRTKQLLNGMAARRRNQF